MREQEKTKLFELIEKGEVQEVIDVLKSVEISASKKKEALAIASRYSRWKRKQGLGILSFEQETLTENKISHSLIELINHPDNQAFPKGKSIDHQHPTKPIWWKYLAVATLVLSIFIGFAEISCILDIFPNPQKALQLTVFVTDVKGDVVLENQGRINTSLGHRPLNASIGEHGRAHFPDILPKTGDTITIGLNAEGWEVAVQNTFIFMGKPIQLTVKRDDSLGWIKGMVKSRDGQTFIEGATVLVNTDTTVVTNESGIFKLLLPPVMRVKKKIDQYKLTISKEGFRTQEQYFTPNTADAEIRLEE